MSQSRCGNCINPPPCSFRQKDTVRPPHLQKKKKSCEELEQLCGDKCHSCLLSGKDGDMCQKLPQVRELVPALAS